MNIKSKMEILEQLDKLKEEFYTDARSVGTNSYREIFVNPSKSEVSDILDEEVRNNLRFIADKDRRKVYLAGGDVFHYIIARESGFDEDYFFYDTFAGTAKFEGGKVLALTWTDYLNDEDEDVLRRVEELSKEILAGEYDWMKRYNFDLSIIKGLARDEIEFVEDYFSDKRVTV